jgi:CheY-like chemotaxis protein
MSDRPAAQAHGDAQITDGPLVLVIDDNAAFATLVTTVLESLGCQVERAASGVEGLGKVASRPPALILLDLHMPEMDGIGVLKRLRGRPPFDKIPVIVLTARQAIDDVTMACRLGATDYMTKPLDPANLVAKVLRQLPARRRRIPSNRGPTPAVLKDGDPEHWVWV